MSRPVVIVGAGVAGLAAAAKLREDGIDTLVLEATDRAGGRARTLIVEGLAFDSGASWLHDARHNPLTEIARDCGETLRPSPPSRERRKYIGERRATAAEMKDFDDTAAAFSAVAEARAKAGPDISLTAATQTLADRDWTATVAYWEACLIAAADPADLSLRDWWVNQLDGENLEIAGGLGAFVERRLAPAAGPVRYASPVTSIAWGDETAPVVVTTAMERISAPACIVTVSTGVLAAGTIRFDPPLPEATRAAIEGLPMGLLSKIVIPTPQGERFGIPDDTSIQQRVTHPDEAMLSCLCFPSGRDHIVGFVGGPGAWRLAREGVQAMDRFAREQLARAFGGAAVARMGTAVISNWADDPAFRGSYAYARPGHAAARGTLAEPLADGRLIFAGEATRTDGYAGTVAGAYLAGRQAAAQIRR